MRTLVLAGMLVACACPAMAATNVDVAAYLKRDEFKELKLSPDGAYYAASVPLADHSLLAVVRRADNKVTATFNLGKDDYVATFAWVSPGRLLIESARKFGELDQPALTGNIYAMNADGSDKAILVGQDVNVNSVDSHIQQKKTETIAAFLLDPLPDDDRTVLISVEPFTGDSFSRVERMDVFSGRRILVMRAPVQNANFVTDGNGDVRFAYGYDAANHHKLYYRSGAGAADWTHAAGWTLLNDENASSHVEVPLGFSADGRYAYLEVEQPQGPDAVVALDTRDGSRKTLVQDDDSDPVGVIRSLGTPYPAPVGVFINDGKPRTAFFDDNAPEARLYRSLEAAFAGQSVVITSKTADGHLALVEVSSDRNPGDFYLFDTVNKKADFLTARRSWLDPEAMAEVRPFQMKARDGQVLHGFLTVPHGSDGKRLPLVVLPHGGPIGIADAWGFDDDAQLLAAAGYGVLQVNFRGSGGYGRSFSQAGAREWGGKMQDDLTDATRWAIAQGVADGARICLYGASYGGYAALMGAAKEPTLYRCAAGYVGVYDLPMMYHVGDTHQVGSGKSFLHEWLGDDEAKLQAVSPVNLAAHIKVPVFLAAGGEDERAPIEHSKRMEKALRAAGVPVETLYYPTEGHGFFVDEHRQAFYTQLLAFLGRNLGGAGAAAPATGAGASH